jgi:hypothetical protein
MLGKHFAATTIRDEPEMVRQPEHPSIWGELDF